MNMGIMMKRFFKFLAYLISWLFFSPLILLLNHRWRSMRTWVAVLLVILSPLGLSACAVLVAYLLTFMESHQRKTHYTRHEVVERITDVSLPSFEIVEYTKDDLSFQGDYMDEAVIRFHEDIPESTFVRIDSLATIKGNGWSVHEDRYHYSWMWGNGIPAPQGENEDEDGIFSLTLQKGSRQATLQHGRW